jgi:hypothetical protein
MRATKPSGTRSPGYMAFSMMPRTDPLLQNAATNGRFGILGDDVLPGGATGIRTPDLLHAISRQHVHQCLSSQVTVPERAHQSGQVCTGCGTFLLYGPVCPVRLPMSA